MEKKSKIMVIDDSRMILKIAKDIIEKNLPNCDVTPMLDATEAMDELKKDEYHIVLLDIVMPEISGIDVLKWIKGQKSLAFVKVIMFTSLNDSGALKECFEEGAHDYVTKPLDESEFIARVNHAVKEYDQEEIIRQNYSQLEAMNKSLKQAQAELAQKDRLSSVGHLAAGMAHEVNNPLGFLGSNVTTMGQYLGSMIELYEEVVQGIKTSESQEALMALIEKKEEAYDWAFVKEDYEEVLTDIRYGVTRIKTIIDALRKFSEADPYDSNQPISLKSTIEDIIAMNSGKVSDGIHFELDIRVTNEIYANKADFNLSILSLINNAIDAIRAKEGYGHGEIRVNASEVQDYVVIIITDDGVGMKDKVLKHAFDPFFTTKDVGEGVGLGLTNAYNCFVNDMKGSLEIQSELGVGTEAIVTFKRER